MSIFLLRVLDPTGSELWILGDWVEALGYHIFPAGADAKIYGDGVHGNVQATYHTSGDAAGYTVVAVPEPATIAMLGLGGLLLRKRK